MLWKRLQVISVLGLLLADSGLGHADPFLRIDSENQTREDLLGNREFPWLNRFRLTLPYRAARIQFNVDGEFEADLWKNGFEKDLYAANAVWSQPNLGLLFEGGRFLSHQGNAIFPIDGGQILWNKRSFVSFRLLGGIRRHYEIKDFSRGSLLVGGDVSVDPFPLTTATAGYRFEDDLRDVRRQWVVGAIRQALPVLAEPVFFGSIDYRPDERFLGVFHAGIQLHPSERFQLSGEIARYNEADDQFRWEDEIYLLFARSPEWQQRGTLAYEATKGLHLLTSYSRQTYDVSPGAEQRGHLFKLGGDWRKGIRPLSTHATFFLEDSYGGRSFGTILAADKEILPDWHAGGRFAIAKYDKITGSNDYALHVGARVSHIWKWGLEIGLATEFNSNVDQPKDFRAGLIARYLAL